jgi:hypothetical protein
VTADDLASANDLMWVVASMQSFPASDAPAYPASAGAAAKHVAAERTDP